MLTRSARVIERAFDAALVQAGGSAPIWLILISLKSGGNRNQRELARMIGIRGATLTHHLNAMETAGLISRRRDPDNRRIHIVEMTGAGDATFRRLRDVAASFDRRLRADISGEDLALFSQVLKTMYANVTGTDSALTDFLPVRPPS
jgi:MarR family transcriptional regulator, transcriptional regulator for hemolysin